MPKQIQTHKSVLKLGVSLTAISLLMLTLSISTNGLFLDKVNAATTGTTAVSQTITGGTLSLTSTATTTLSAVTVNIVSNQNATGNLGTVTMSDARGTGVGWSTTATSSNFVQVGTAVKQTGSNNTVTSGGTYNNAVGGTYTVTIAAGGAVGTATYTVSGLETQTSTTTGAGVAIGTRGVTATFAAATYVAGDSWTIRVDILPVTGFTMTASAVTTVSGSATGVTAGSPRTFISTADPATISVASSGNGMGSYTNNPALQLVVPAGSFAGTYSATITETIS